MHTPSADWQHMYARGLGIESTDAHGHTPLILAARYGAATSLRVLLQLGANVEVCVCVCVRVCVCVCVCIYID